MTSLAFCWYYQYSFGNTHILGGFMSPSRPLPTLIGVTENALRALLVRTLSLTSIPGYAAWVILNAMSTAAPADSWRETVADSLKASPAEIDATLAELRTIGLIGNEEALTPAGTAELAAARKAVSGATLPLIEGIDEAEQATARRVLDAIRLRAEESLSA
jgi:hypothetical protein